MSKILIPTTKQSIGLGNVDNTSDINKPISTATQNSLDLKINSSEKGSAFGVATLGADSKVPVSQLPATAITNTYVVTSQASMLALTAQTGDVAVRTDLNKTFILSGTNPSVLSDWQELLTPTDSVTSVNGLTGTVILTTADIADNTNRRYVTDAQQTVIQNTSGVNTGDQDLSGYVPTSRTVNGHALSSNVTITKSDIGLGNADNTSDINKPVSTATQTALDLKINLSEKGSANGVATLGADSKVPASQLPAIAITDTFVVTSEVNMLALTAQTGDIAVRTDLNKTFILKGTDATQLTDWQELLTPTDSVTSVNGLTGAVTLTTDEIDSVTNKRYVTDSDLTNLSNLSGVNTGDQDLSGKEDVGVAQDLIDQHELDFDHSLIATALQSESDPVFNTWLSGVTPTNWDTAYSWGDHSLVGYLTSESDPVFSASEAALLVAGDKNRIDQSLIQGDNVSSLENDGVYLTSHPPVLEILSDPPLSPSVGDRYLVGDSALNDFAGHETHIAEWTGSIWTFTACAKGVVLWITSENKFLRFSDDETTWENLSVAPIGYLTDAPSDGQEYVRKDGDWEIATGGGGGGGSWGTITGDINDQTDLITLLADYAKIDGNNQPFTDDITVSKSLPKLIVESDATDNPKAWLEKMTTLDGTRLISQGRLYSIPNGLTLAGSTYGSGLSYTSTGALSVSFWWKTASSGDSYFIGNSSATSDFRAASGILAFNDEAAGLGRQWTLGTYNNNTWRHIVLTISSDRATVKAYINGVEATQTQAGTVGGNFIINRIFATNGNTNGSFDDFRILTRELSLVEIQAIYNSGAPIETDDMTDMYAYYKLNATSGTTVADSSGNGRTVTLVGGSPVWSTGIVGTTPSALSDIPILAITNNSTASSYGNLQFGYYETSRGTSNFYEGLTHQFNILGTAKLTLDSTTLTINNAVSIAANNNLTMGIGGGRFYVGSGGTGANPAISQASDTNSGININNDQIDFCTAGIVRVQLSNSTTRLQFGSVAVPGIGFTGDTDQGFYGSVGLVGVSSGNYAAVTWTNATTTSNATTSFIWNVASFTNLSLVSNQIKGLDGTASLPFWSFINDTDIGIYRVSSNVLGFATAGIQRMNIGSGGGVTITMPTDASLSGMTAIVPTTATTIGGTYAGLSLVNSDLTNNNYARMDFLDAANGTSSAVIVCRFVNHTTKEGNLGLHVNNGGTRVERIDMYTLETVVNESGANIDFRVEGNSDENLIFADASTDSVGFGTNTPAYKVDVEGTGHFSGQLNLDDDLNMQSGGEILLSATSIISNGTMQGDWQFSTGVIGVGITPNIAYSILTAGDIYSQANLLANGFVDVSNGYKVGGVAGITSSGSFTIFTVVGGIITSAS